MSNGKYFSFHSLIYFCIKKYGSVKFIQIGGCDGISFDPLYPVIKARPEAFQGIILEPIEDYYKELKSTYRHFDGIKTLRYAIHNPLKKAFLYKPDPEALHKLPHYAKGTVSLNKNHLEKLNIPPHDIVKEKVPCKTLGEVMKEYEIEDPDLLLIDAEGYDVQILMNFNFDMYRPAIIRFEHGIRENMISNEQLESIFKKLHDHHYEMIFEDFDIVAIHRKLLLSITR